MKTFNQLRRILIAVEDSKYSESASNYAYELANKLNAEIALVHVSEMPVSAPYSVDPILNEPAVLLPETIVAQEDASKKLLGKVAEFFGDKLTIYTFNKIGNPRDEILLTAEEWKADMIILGTHGRTGFDHFITGSVAERVVRKAKCPVLVIPNTYVEE